MNSAITLSNSITYSTLLECDKGAKVIVTEVQAQPKFGKNDSSVGLRLKELGFLPGAMIEVIGFGFLGSDPLAVKVNGTKFALRRTEAEKIKVEIIPTGKH